MGKPKVKVYIDGANIFYTQKKLGWSIDWKKMRNYIEADREVIEWRYYVGTKKDDEKMQKYLRYLDAIGFNLFTKILKKIRIYNNDIHSNPYKTNFIYKANFDVEMTTDILLDKTKTDEAIIFTGDSDFRYLIRKLKDVGKKVAIFSSRKTISWELKLEASEVIYLEDIKEHIARE
ncbi:NYN domain-containing protein [Patescibacteria group bacterium]|nr:NYN domain-containing protein [Patescibacteria group bacterium]MBU4023420.1 NYN domain-containing protein [Patescibacteria group bacterium]MBU4077999.1 NYN domain-containing protein [Patescibacteria group bacterium]